MASDDDIIDEEELVQFYTEFVKLDISDAKEKGKRAMEEMTDVSKEGTKGHASGWTEWTMSRGPEGPGGSNQYEPQKH